MDYTQHPERRTMFAWWPVTLSVYRAPYWHLTDRRAWLRRVNRIRTIYGVVLYSELP